jgi:predicted TIM-barrel fold metal-dependent hydrolase
MWLSGHDLKRLKSAARMRFRPPIPTQMISNGEFMPLPQTREQAEVERRLRESARRNAARLGLEPAEYLRTKCGMAAAFIAMNEVHGEYFGADPAEADDPEAARKRAGGYASQFVFDAQTHHVRPAYRWESLLNLRRWTRGQNPWKSVWNRAGADLPEDLEQFKFEAYVRNMFLESDTRLAILTGFTSETKEAEPLNSDEIVRSRELLNKLAGSRRLYAQGLFWPGFPGNLEEMDRIATELRIDSWKGYAVGDLLAESIYPWRMDDEKITYPAYERARKHGIRNISVHKGLLPAVDPKAFRTWRYAMVDDVGRAARDFPDLNFIIYHAGFRPLLDASSAVEEFRQTGRISWVTDLAEIPAKYGVSNVYAELGTTFATTCVTFPELAATLVAQCVRGMGADHVLWGTDSIWWGSPQWQIEALRRLEVPERLRKSHDLPALGPGDGEVKNKIFGLNLARLFGVDPGARAGAIPPDYLDRLSALKAQYEKHDPLPSQVRYGWVRKREDAALVE